MRSRSRAGAAAPRSRFRQALILGLLHGPAELLPISSSAHVIAVPWLLGWDYQELDPEPRKAFEVALHAGSTAALLIACRGEGVEALRGSTRRELAAVALAALPPAIAGYLLEGTIERRLGTPATVAAALAAGSLAMAAADRAPEERRSGQAGVIDAVWLGLAQACALVPGVSRSGASRTAARLRRFTRQDANRLSSQVALPVIVGATLLKTIRLRSSGLDPQVRAPFAAGAAASFASTLTCTWLIRHVERESALLPYAVYRGLLAAVIARTQAARRVR